MSPDDFHNDSHPGDPQSWNLYAYGRNNPLRFIDPAGEAVQAYDTNGTLLCEDLDCQFDAKSNLIVGDRTYAPNQYTVGNPTPAVTVKADAGTPLQYVGIIAYDAGATVVNGFLSTFNWLSQKSFGFSPSYSQELTTAGTPGEPIGVVASFAMPGPGGKINVVAKTAKAFRGDVQALIELAKKAQKTGITKEEAKLLLKWAKEVGLHARDDINTTHWVGGSHIHVGPIRHIPVK